jgi:hypothetical protein
MKNVSKDTGNKMKNSERTEKNLIDERENERLRRMLQKAVRKEKAPESLRERIGKMIRE